MKKYLTMLGVLALVLGCSGCSNGTTQEEPKEPVVEAFAAELEVNSVSYTGPINDTFIFEGETTDGIVTKLNFDVIRNKGKEGEYSKKGIMGYQMNVSDAAIEATEGGLALTHLDIYGYTEELGQYMIYTNVANLTDETTFKELTVMNYTGEVFGLEKSLPVYQYLANEAGITLTGDTKVSELLAIFGLYKDGAYVAGTNRVSFAGFNGGRSYGEQLDAIVNHILSNNMTLEAVVEMFKTVNPQSQPILERDTVAGATIAFVGDFQKVAYLAAYGELFQGVNSKTVVDGNTVVEVLTQGFGGEIKTNVTVDSTGKVIAIQVVDAKETDGIGAVLTAEGSDYLNALVAGQADLASVDAVAGATVTSEALKKAVQFAIDEVK